MMTSMSPGLFALRSQDPMSLTPQLAPLPAVGAPDPSAQASPAAPSQSFIWGGAGDRLSDSDIAQRDQLAQQEITNGMSYAPVQSWTQGAARVAQALVGGFQKHEMDKASAANVTANNDALALLSKPGANEQTIASLLTDGTLSDGLHEYAKAKLAAMNKAPPKPVEHASQLIAEGLTPGTPVFESRMHDFNTQQEMGTPFVYEQFNPVTKATDKIITTRAAISGAAGAAGSAGPPPEAITYLRQNPGMAAHFDEKYGPGASQHYLTGGATPSGSATFP